MTGIIGSMRRGVLQAGLAALLLCLAPAAGECSLSIKPAFIEVDLGKGRPSESITVENITEEEMRYRVQVVHFIFDEGGNVAMIPPDQHSMAQWIKCNPREFTLAPKSARTIRLTILPPVTLPSGEYWAAVWFEPLSYNSSSVNDGKGRKMTLNVETNILIPVIGRMPTPSYSCSLTGLVAEKTEGGVAIAASVANSGTGRVQLKGNYEILDASNTKVAGGLIGDDTIMAGGRRIFKQQVKGEFFDSDYTVRVQYTSERLPEALAGQTQVK